MIPARARSRTAPFSLAAAKPKIEQSAAIRAEIDRPRTLARVPVTLPNGKPVTLSAGRQNPLIKAVVEEFCPRFTPGAVIAHLADTGNKFPHLDQTYLAALGIQLNPATKMPDVVSHDTRHNWLILVDAVTSAGVVDNTRRMELKQLFKGSKAGLIFVTAFETRQAMQPFASEISWESEVWIAEAPDHLIHFNGERLVGPYSDVMPDFNKHRPHHFPSVRHLGI